MPKRLSDAFVTCPKCGVEHNTKQVETLNIEEDAGGRDVITFRCPLCNKQRTSLVRIK
jgi:transcription elongation factor Elf1